MLLGSWPAVVLVAVRLVDHLLDPLPNDPVSQTCPSPDSLNCLFDVDLDAKPAVVAELVKYIRGLAK